MLASFAVSLSVVRVDHAFMFVACVRSQRKCTYVLIDTRVKRSCFLEWQGGGDGSGEGGTGRWRQGGGGERWGWGGRGWGAI